MSEEKMEQGAPPSLPVEIVVNDSMIAMVRNAATGAVDLCFNTPIGLSVRCRFSEEGWKALVTNAQRAASGIIPASRMPPTPTATKMPRSPS